MAARLLRLRSPLCAALGAALLLTAGSTAQAGALPTNHVHNIPFFIHADLLGPGMDLAFYQDLLDAALEDVRILTYGAQGPFDTSCCTEVVASGTPGATLTVFDGTDAGRAASALNVINFDADQADLQSIVGSGSGVFIVDSLSNCGGSPDAIGCASTPTCDGNLNDNPNLITVVTLDAIGVGSLGQTIAHERGHNACLVHGTTTDQCQLMRPAAGGGCLTQSECNDYIAGRTGASGTCSCQFDPGGIDDETVCMDHGVAGQCSGGVCDPTGSATSTRFAASADPDFVAFWNTIGSAVYDAQLTISAAPGNWVNQGAWNNAVEPQGLEYAPTRDIIYGVARTPGDDVLLRISPVDGSTISSTPITGRVDIIALAWNPGPTASPTDDRLFGLDSDFLPPDPNIGFPGGAFEDLISINPDSGSSVLVGPLALGAPGRITGLAYDPLNDQLFSASFAGLHLIDRTTCGQLCAMKDLRDPASVTGDNPDGQTLAKAGAGLAYSSETGNIYLIGNQGGVTLPGPSPPAGTFRTTEYVVVLGGTVRTGLPGGADFVDTLETIGLDGMTVGGLAAFPVPEPAAALLALAALTTLATLRRR